MSAWALTMRLLLGKRVEVTISDDPAVVIVGILHSFDEGGEVCVRMDDGDLRWAWPNLHIRELPS